MPADAILGLTSRIQDSFNIPSSAVTEAIKPYTVQQAGMYDSITNSARGKPAAPVYFVPSDKHYSWPKAGACWGLASASASTSL